MHRNKDRDAINTASFLNYLETHGTDKTIMILSSEIEVGSKNDGNKPLKDENTFWSTCGEDDCEPGDRTRIDPVLKLYPGCPLMLVANTDVKAGEANGSQATVTGITLKHSAQVTNKKLNGYTVKAVRASDVEHIRVKLNLNKNLKEKKIKAKTTSFICSYPTPPELQSSQRETFKLRMKAKQFPLVSNTATTGHKLQGATKEALYIPYWHYGTPNWPYVMLSRVKTRYGLYLGQPLDPNRDYSPDWRIVNMLKRFQTHVPPRFEHDFF